MSIRKAVIQYIGDTLRVPNLERPVSLIVTENGRRFVPEKRKPVEDRDRLIRDLLERRCRQSCADCEHEEDDGCEFMRRAIEIGAVRDTGKKVVL